jgi:hypothetical protein
LKVQIPHNWHTRPYQNAAYNYLTKGGTRYVGVNHRRWGKDALLLNSTCFNLHKRIGGAWHMLPEASQAKKAIWDAVDEFTGVRLIDQAFPEDIRSNWRDNDMFMRLKIGSTWQVVGSDNFQSLIGSPPILVVFSEYAYANPIAWQKISPILMNNGGIAAFISTPCGRNHFHGLYEYARSPEGQEAGWFAELQTVDDTDAIVYANFASAKARGKAFVFMGKTYDRIEDVPRETRKEITKKSITDEERQLTAQRGAQEAQAIIAQEYYCSFQAAIPGSYYGPVIERMERAGKIMRVPYDPGFLVECWWDLGIRDDTAIWFVQHVGRERRVIDYYEAAGVGIDYYIDVLNGKCSDEDDATNLRRSEYRYSPHVLPHDAYHRQLSQRGGASLADVVEKDYRHPVRRPGPNPTKSLQLSIQQVRTFLPTCVFDEQLTKDGLDKLRQYRRVWNTETRSYNDTPLHDFSSHAADSYRTGVENMLGQIVAQGEGRGVKSDWDRLEDGQKQRYAIGAEDDVLGRDA